MLLILPEHLQRLFQKGLLLRQEGYRGRFAPSPTGPLHIGNLRTALLSWIRARSLNGKWLLRIDDLDTSRNRVGSVDSIQDDLLWLGLYWDGPVIFQSDRKGIYSSVLSFLRSQNQLYACRCSRRVLTETTIDLTHRRNVYPGTCRNLDLFWGWEEKKLPSWRLKVTKEFEDTCGDVLVRRSDGVIAYHLATVVDELTFGVTEVIRGEDLAIGYLPQVAVVKALQQQLLAYKYLPLVYNNVGKKLSKRDDVSGLKVLRSKGMDPEEVIGMLAASLGLVPKGSSLTALELLYELRLNEKKLNRIFH